MNVLRVDNHVDNNSYTYVLCKRNVLVRCDADARAATAFVVFRFIVYLPLALRFSLYSQLQFIAIHDSDTALYMQLDRAQYSLIYSVLSSPYTPPLGYSSRRGAGWVQARRLLSPSIPLRLCHWSLTRSGVPGPSVSHDLEFLSVLPIQHGHARTFPNTSSWDESHPSRP